VAGQREFVEIRDERSEIRGGAVLISDFGFLISAWWEKERTETRDRVLISDLGFLVSTA
jgi:hypothetical protein